MWFVVEEIYSNISKINVLVFKGNFAKNLKDYLLQVPFKTRNKKGKDNSSSFLIYKGSCKKLQHTVYQNDKNNICIASFLLLL